MALPLNWTISDVGQQEYVENNIEMYFSINNVAYSLRVRMVKGFFKPQYVSHLGYDKCVTCQQKETYYSICDSFEPYLLDLFYELIQFPSIRLEWLYLPYVEEK